MINANIQLDVNVRMAGIHVQNRTRANTHAGQNGASAHGSTHSRIGYSGRPRPQEPATPPSQRPERNHGDGLRAGLDRSIGQLHGETRPAQQQGEASAKKARTEGEAASRPFSEAAGKAASIAGRAVGGAYGEADRATEPAQDAVVEAAWIGARAATDTYRTAIGYAQRRGEDAGALSREATLAVEKMTSPAREQAGEVVGHGSERAAGAVAGAAHTVKGLAEGSPSVQPEIAVEGETEVEADVSPRSLQAAMDAATRVDIKV